MNPRHGDTRVRPNTWIGSATRALPAAALLLGACTVGPDYAPPEPKVPDAFGRLTEEITGPTRTVAGEADLTRWWSRLNDPVLDTLVDRAVSGNHDLRVAEGRLREARAARTVTASDAWPTVDAVGGYSRSRLSENVSSGRFSNQDSSGNDLYAVGFDARWEIDVFGGVRRAVEAAEADIQTAQENTRDVLVSLVAEVARNYVEVRTFQTRLDIANRNVQVAQDAVDLSDSRFKAGLTSELDVAQARAQLEVRAARIPQLRTGLAQTVHRLGVLLGSEPMALAKELEAVRPIPAAPSEIPVGVPSDLLRRRPDVRRAERQLASATARIGVATAELFPKFSLTGFFELQSDQIGNLAEGDSRAWAIGPAVRWNVFDAGRIRAQIAVENARQEQAVAFYERAVLISLEDAENALVALSQEQTRRAALTRAVDANARAVDLATQLYSSGLRDFLNVLASNQQLFESEDQLAVSEHDVTTSLISLYKALGGGWEDVGPPPEAPTQAPPPAGDQG